GDTARSFVTEGGRACLLLADGMGSGPAAAQDSRSILSLMERFLRAGIPPADALRTVAPAFRLRVDGTRGVTLDALTIDLFTGKGECLKCGAAPSFLRTSGAVTRLSGGNLPVGLSDEPAASQSVPIRMTHGDLFVLVSDGVCDGSDDDWLRHLLHDRASDTPKEIAAKIVVSATERGISDDLTAMVVRLERRPASS
ncbi:MAG: SpoIIE family protein phosphatase, partial [Butyricicoccus sp.]|nr:SpoIIE family protein phosphatase [Butyricicoccus sp.]